MLCQEYFTLKWYQIRLKIREISSKKVFDWKFTQTPDPHGYWTIDTGDSQLGINGGLTRSREPFEKDRMTNSVEVPSVDTYSEKVIQAGGKAGKKISMPNMGYLALCEDIYSLPLIYYI